MTNVLPVQGQERTKVLERTTYRCTFGPEDYSQNLPSDKSAANLSKGERRKNVEYGHSIRMGCQAYFTVVILKERPDICEIRYESGARQHVKKNGCQCHGAGCKETGLAQLAPRLSRSIKDKVACQLRRGLRPAEIIRQIHKDYQQAFMIQHQLSSLEEAATAMSVSPLPCLS